jgi:hypothetical protein
MIIYVAQVTDPKYRTLDCETMEEAKAEVEAAGSGSVVSFRRERNLPRCLPEFVDKCFAMETFENGAWRHVNVFGG